MINADGTAECDRCGADLPGYGVAFGMVCVDMSEEGEAVQRIFCYGDETRESCRDILLEAAS